MSAEMITRQQILAGLPAKRAAALLFLIEARTAHLKAHSRQAMERFLTPATADERDLAYIQAYSLGRQLPLHSNIQDLEHFAPHWASLVPEPPPLRAVIAHALAQKYRFTYPDVPKIRNALGLDDASVQQAYQQRFGQPLETIYATRPTLAARLQWASAAFGRWLESLSPFWTAFALTLTETVGAGVLALPIAIAGVGPLAGLVLLVVMGLINMLTVAFMAEVVSRSGVVRYGGGYTGRMVNDYVGNVGSIILSTATAILCFIALQAYYVGFSTTLADATRLPAWSWTVLLFLVGLYFLRRESLNATVASALVTGAISIVLIILLSAIAFSQAQLTHLSYVNVPFIGGRPFDPKILQLIFGVVLSAYFGHLSVSNCARVVLRRDPGGRSLLRGVVAAQGAAMLIYCVWALAINGAIAPEILGSLRGTVLAPLAIQVGPLVHIVGSVYVILTMSIASIHFSLGLYNTVRERLPAQRSRILMLARRKGRLVFQPRGHSVADIHLSLTYLGTENDLPHFRIDIQSQKLLHRTEIAITEHWDIAEMFERIPELSRAKIHLALEVRETSHEVVYLQITTPLRMRYEGELDTIGLRMADVLDLPEPLRRLIQWMLREGEVTLAQVIEEGGNQTGLGPDDTEALLEALVAEGFVSQVNLRNQTTYRVSLAMRRERQFLPKVQAYLEKQVGDGQPKADRGRSSVLNLLGERGRFLISISPIVVVFLFTEWLLFTGGESFAGPINYIGTLIVPLLAGIFPALLLIAARKKGECLPKTIYKFLGHPALTLGVCLIFWISILVHGLVIWQAWVPRLLALGVSTLVVGIIVTMVWRGAFASRLVVELRGEDPQQPAGEGTFAVLSGGRPTMADVRLTYASGECHSQAEAGEVPNFSDLQEASFRIPAGDARELKVWAFRLTPGNIAEGLPATLKVRCGEIVEQQDMRLSNGQALIPLEGGEAHLEVRLEMEKKGQN